MLYKTQLCSFYAKGICARGNKCSWAHGELDVRPMPKFYKTRMCYTFLSGSYCEASKCTFAHTEEELRGSGKALRLCTKYFLDGYCAKADKCPMAHNINQLDPSVKFSSSELMNRMYNEEVEEMEAEEEEEEEGEGGGDEPSFYTRKTNKKRDESESNDGDNGSADINGGDPLSVNSNLYIVKDEEENPPEGNKNRYAGMGHLEGGEKDARASHRNAFNFLKGHGKKTYKGDAPKSRGPKGDNLAKMDFTQNGEFNPNEEVAKMGDKASCREVTYDDRSFGCEGEVVPARFFGFMVGGDQLGKAKLPSEPPQNGFSPAEGAFLPSADPFVGNFRSVNELDQGSVHSNVLSNVHANVHANVHGNVHGNLHSNVLSNYNFEALSEMEGYNHLNVQAEKYLFGQMKKKENPEHSIFDSNTTTYEQVKSGSNFYADGVAYLNRTKENMGSVENLGSVDCLDSLGSGDCLDHCGDLGLRFNYSVGRGGSSNGVNGAGDLVCASQGGGFNKGGRFNCVSLEEDRFNRAAPEEDPLNRISLEEDRFNRFNRFNRLNRFTLERLIQNMNSLSLANGQMATHPLVKTARGESASGGEPAELKDTKEEGEMGSQGDVHTGGDTHSEGGHSGEDNQSGDNQSEDNQSEDNQSGNNSEGQSEGQSEGHAEGHSEDPPPEAEQTYEGASFSNGVSDRALKMLLLRDNFTNHLNVQNGYSGQCRQTGDCHNGVGGSAASVFAGGGSSAFTTNGLIGGVSGADFPANGVANLCSLRNVQTSMPHMYSHQNNGTPNSSRASASSVHDQMMEAPYDMSNICRKINSQRSMTEVKTLQKGSSDYSFAGVPNGQHYPSAGVPNGQHYPSADVPNGQHYLSADVPNGQQYPSADGFPPQRGVETKTENYKTQEKNYFFNYINNCVEGGTTAGRRMDGVSEKDMGARATQDGIILPNGSEHPRGSRSGHSSHGSIGNLGSLGSFSSRGSLVSLASRGNLGSLASRDSLGSCESGNDTVMKNILMGKTSLYCTPNCSGVDANGEGIENGGIYNSRERNLPKEDPSGELGRTEELHKMLMNDCANGMANYNIGDFFFLKNEGEHLNGLTYLHGENALQGRVNSFGDNTNLDDMCQVNYGGFSTTAVGFTRRAQQSAAVEGGLLNGASLHGGFGRGNQGEHQNQAYRNDCCGQEKRTQVAMYSHPIRLMGTQRDHSPMNPHIDSYELAYKTDESFTNYVHNAGREVAERGKANPVAENGRGEHNEEGLSDGSNQDNENPPRSYNPLTYSFSGLCECLARGEEEEGVDVVDVVDVVEEEEEA